jgi:hypothetical protein
LGHGIVGTLYVIGNDLISTATSNHASDAYRLHRRAVGGSCWANVKGYLTAALVFCGTEMLENGKLIDKPKGKGAKVISTTLGS